MKTIMFNLLLTIFLWLGSCCIASAQDTASSDQITDPDQQIIQDDSSTTGKFQPVTVDPSATTDVKLQFPTSAVGKPVIVQPLDGGTLGIDPDSAVIDDQGALSFPFQVGDQPGVYRVLVIAPNADADSPNIIGVAQFEVPNPAE